MDVAATEWSDDMKKGNLIVSLIIILLINIGIFVVVDDYSGLFWINYGFVMTALLVSTYFMCFSAKNEKLMEKLNVTAAVCTYLICEIVTGLICSSFDEDHQAVAVVIHLIILGAFIIFFYSTLSANAFIKQQQELRGRELLNFRYVIEKMKNIQRKIPYTAAYKKDIDKAFDSLASGQTSSNAEVEPLEREIIDTIDILNTAVDNNDEQLIISTCSKINQLASERDSKLKLRSNF